jgi:hypothetical protein
MVENEGHWLIAGKEADEADARPRELHGDRHAGRQWPGPGEESFPLSFGVQFPTA